MTDKLKDLITAIGEEQGWSVKVYGSEISDTSVEFQRYSSEGQDYSFLVSDFDDTDDFVKELRVHYEDFDADYEASLWIGSDGHGKNGAPFHIKYIINDMEEMEAKLGELYEAFESRRGELKHAACRKIEVQITEYLQRIVEVDAANDKEAEQLAHYMIDEGEIVLDDKDFTTREIKVYKP